MVTNSQRKIAISVSSAQEIISFLVSEAQKPEMSLHFIGKRRISVLHDEYFGDPSPTDCITFPYGDPHFLGEVFVCPEVAQDYISQNGGDLSEEITLYIVHGFLHLLGFDDQNLEAQKIMRFEEKKWIRKLAKKNLTVTIKNND